MKQFFSKFRLSGTYYPWYALLNGPMIAVLVGLGLAVIGGGVLLVSALQSRP